MSKPKEKHLSELDEWRRHLIVQALFFLLVYVNYFTTYLIRLYRLISARVGVPYPLGIIPLGGLVGVPGGAYIE